MSSIPALVIACLVIAALVAAGILNYLSWRSQLSVLNEKITLVENGFTTAGVVFSTFYRDKVVLVGAAVSDGWTAARVVSMTQVLDRYREAQAAASRVWWPMGWAELRRNFKKLEEAIETLREMDYLPEEILPLAQERPDEEF